MDGFIVGKVLLEALAICVLSLWHLMVKMGDSGWKVLIPGYNVYAYAKRAWRVWVCVPLLALLLLAVFLPGSRWLWLILAMLLLGFVTGAAFGKNMPFTLGLMVLPVVFYPLLALGGAECTGAIPLKCPDMDQLRYGKAAQSLYRRELSAMALPGRIRDKAVDAGKGVVGLFKKIGQGLAGIVTTFINGDWKTRLSYLVMGAGSIARGQYGRGILFFLFQTVFNIYIIYFGGAYLAKLGTLGDVPSTKTGRVITYGDNSFFILLYGVLTIFFILAFVYTWYQNIKQNRISQQILASGHTLKSTRDDLHSLVDSQFHKTLLALPTLGVVAFTILPIFFMILVAFTNFDKNHQPPQNLFTWVGWENFHTLLSADNASYGDTFRQVLLWTLIWAFFATFLNYFLGMLVAMLINKKGIKFKKVWRTILVMTIAIPQFVSLLYVSKMFARDGLINNFLVNTLHLLQSPIPFWEDAMWARITIIIINIWIGIPYLMLIATGILMNIPADLYESARIDGANAVQMYGKITLPYMLFVTGPYLLTSFTGNINNFNVIFLLNQGKPMGLSGNAGHTDLLITWLYRMTVDDTNYKVAAVIGILVFVVTAVINLVVYNMIPSVKNEEDFQ